MRADKPSTSILVVEDDRNIGRLVATYLEREGYEVTIADDGAQALTLATSRSPSLVILDVMLPSLDGWEVCRRIRRDSDVPIILLTARGDELDRIRGFTLGVDDYVVKPFSPAELVERVKAILRRARSTPAREDNPLVCGTLTVDAAGHTVTVEDRPVSVTPSEFRLLRTLIAAPGRVFSRDALLDQIHPEGDAVIDRVVDVHVGHLRRKIERDPANPRYLKTVRGAGYKLVEPDGG